MPQLNPAPWFPIMCAAWATLAILLLPKMARLHHTVQPHPPELAKTQPAGTWTWPWS